MSKIYVWDLPLRIFHWALAFCVIACIVSANIGGNGFAWHFRFGYAVIALLVFRIIWGFAGSKYARFSSFPPSPSRAVSYLKNPDAHARKHGEGHGHNPLGALSVYAMLLALCIQVGTGLFANDAIMWDGPLKNYVSNDTSDLLTSVHKINRIVLIALIALHLGAIAFYARIKKQKLVQAMISGYKDTT